MYWEANAHLLFGSHETSPIIWIGKPASDTVIVKLISCTSTTSPQPRKDLFHSSFYSLSPQSPQFQLAAGATPSLVSLGRSQKLPWWLGGGWVKTTENILARRSQKTTVEWHAYSRIGQEIISQSFNIFSFAHYCNLNLSLLVLSIVTKSIWLVANIFMAQRT